MSFAKILAFGITATCFLSAQSIDKVRPALPGKAGTKNATNPYVFKGFKVGTKLSELSQDEILKFKIDKNALKTDGFFTDNIGDALVSVFLNFENFGQGLELNSIEVSTHSVNFTSIASAFKSKFGSPFNTKIAIKHNAFGAKFHGREYTWKQGLYTVTAEEISTDEDRSMFTFSSSQKRKSQNDIRQQKQALDDLSIIKTESPKPTITPEPTHKSTSTAIRDIEFLQLKATFIPPMPPYPSVARMALIQGEVVVEMIIGPTGIPLSAKAIQGPPQLRPTTESHALQWRFEPVIADGKPQSVRTRMSRTYSLTK